MALTRNTKYPFEINEDFLYGDVPIAAATALFEGAAVGDNGSGFARPLVAGDDFRGFAAAGEDNEGAAGDLNVRVRQKGIVEIPVTGVAGPGDIGAVVHATDDGTFNLAGTSPIGKVVRHVGGTTVTVRFHSAQTRMIAPV